MTQYYKYLQIMINKIHIYLDYNMIGYNYTIIINIHIIIVIILEYILYNKIIYSMRIT